MSVGGDDRSPNRNYPVPTPGNWVSEDFARLVTALLAIDDDVDGLLSSVAGKAALLHTHSIAQILGLQAILDGKLDAGGATFALGDLTDVDIASAVTFQVLMRAANGRWQPGVVSANNLADWAARLAASSIDGGQLTGNIADARVPALAGFNVVTSTGDLTVLDTGQQAQIVKGTHVTTTDGKRWVYKGAGSKTLAVSYVELGSITPDWSIIASRPYWAVKDDPSPVGEVKMVLDTVAPPGFIKLNGAAVSRTTYSALYSKFGTRYGAGDGSTTFNIPDFRGLFPRALDDGRGLDGGRTIGTYQAHGLLDHLHSASSSTSIAAAGDHAHSVNVSYFGGNFREAGGWAVVIVGGQVTGPSGWATTVVGNHAHGASTATYIGGVDRAASAENRPHNMSALFCVRY